MDNVYVSEITVNSGQTIQLPERGVICIVGGNNVGKSQMLREIESTFTTPQNLSATVTTQVKIQKPQISPDEAEAFLKENGQEITDAQGNTYYMPVGGGTTLSAEGFLSEINYGPGMSSAADFIRQRFPAGQLSQLVCQPASINPSGSRQTGSFGGMLGPLYYDADMERALSDISEAAFGEPLLFDRTPSSLQFRVGKCAVDAPPVDAINHEYEQALGKLPFLSMQGDGMQSFLGLAVALLLGKQQIMLFDEPEAFLHPPQATALGQWIGRQTSHLDKQVFLSTHDRNVLLGLLESGGDITLLRLTREGNVNHLYELDKDQAHAAWEKPVMRYSNILQGLFHRQVVICEADADCRFYSAVLDVLSGESDQRICSHETLFVPSGGLKGMSSLAELLCSLHIKTYLIVDCDALTSKHQIKSMVTAIGHEWTTELDEQYKPFLDWLNDHSDGFTTEQKKGLVKSNGLEAPARGKAGNAIHALATSLEEMGILVVPAGEMECLDNTVTGDKSDAWVREMFETKKYRDNSAAKQLISPILQGFE
jgi:hypothetical protein